MTDIKKELIAALELALRYHGVMFLSDPPQDAWKAMNVEPVARAAIARAKQQAEPVAVCFCGDPTILNIWHRKDGPCFAPQQAEPVESSAERTLSLLGYTNEGGEYWKPPLGNPRQAEPVAMDKLIQIAWKMGFDAAKAEQAEPVAYCYVRKNSSADALTFDPNPVDAVEGTVFPLYAHPPQQAEPHKRVIEGDNGQSMSGNPSF
jgi:hypothetical protein